MMEDYHYGELDERQTAKVATHLLACDGCRRELALLEREARIYEAYEEKTEGDLEVAPEIWKRAIESATRQLPTAEGRNARKSETRWLTTVIPASPWVRQALAAVLLVAISVSATLLVVGRRHAKETAAMQRESVAAGSSEKSLEAALESIQRAEQEYINAIQQLNAIVERQKPALDPRLVAELQANLKLIDEHIAATRKAYYAHPTDADLALLMLAAYSRKVELLQDLTP
jgi:anti-sigma factor RsiW